MKKTIRQLKQQARQALNGKWGEAALTFFAYFIIVLVAEGGLSLFQLADSGFVHQYQSYVLQGNPEAANFLLASHIGKYSLPMLAIVFLLIGPLAVGLLNTFLYLLRGDKNLVDNMFKTGFKPYWRSVLAYLLMGIKILLWSLLLVIPGIIKSFAYVLTPYILKDNPELTPLEAIKRSNELMKGNKWRFFVMYLSFIGWFFVGILTIGIGLFWIAPYIYTTMAAFYEDIKGINE